MYLRCLIFLVQLFSLGIPSYTPFDRYLIHQNREINNFISQAVIHNETEVESLNSDMIVQVGAFRLEPNALALKSKLSSLINKPVIIVQKDGYFKVQLTGFKSSEEIEALLPALGLLGIRNIWVVPPQKQKEVKSQVVVQADTTIRMIMVKLALPVDEELKSYVSRPVFNLQIGVFHDRSKALRAYKKITTKLNLPVKIVQEWEYYKVFVTGFLSMEETFSYYPRLAHMGYPNIILLETREKR